MTSASPTVEEIMQSGWCVSLCLSRIARQLWTDFDEMFCGWTQQSVVQQ